MVRGSLDEAGIQNSLVYGDFDDPVCLQELKVRVLGAAAGIHLRGQLYGLMGSRSLGMYTAAVDANQWRRQFGLEVESWDQLEVIEKAREMPDQAVEDHLSWVRGEFGSIQVKDEVMRAAIKMYLASKQNIGDRGFDFVSVRCLPETPSTFTTFCYAIALLNDTNDAEGKKEAICCSCESDSNGALTMQILKHLGGGSGPIWGCAYHPPDRRGSLDFKLWLTSHTVGSQSEKRSVGSNMVSRNSSGKLAERPSRQSINPAGLPWPV